MALPSGGPQFQGPYGGPPPPPPAPPSQRRPAQWGWPAGHRPALPGGGPVVIDVGGTAARQLVIGAVAAGVVGAIAIGAGLAGEVDGGGEVVAIVIGAVFLLPAVLVVALRGYRVPLGGNVEYIPIIEQAMVRFAPHIYRGVQATQGFMGLT